MPRRLVVELGDEEARKLEGLAAQLGVDLERMTSVMLEVAASYAGELKSWSQELRVKREHKPYSLFEELFFYGVEAWRSLVARVLDHLKARGRFELEALDFDPREPSVEIEMVALEGSDLKADRIRIYWTPRGVALEVYYYLEKGVEPPQPKERVDFEWYYLPDEHAVVLAFEAEDVTGLPPIHAVDRMAESLGPQV